MNITFKQVIKFVLVGILNTFIDLGALNLLIFASGIASGLGYSAFKGISFTLAVINSYFLNKFWTFKSGGGAAKKEFAQFFTVSAIGFGINVGIASLIVNVAAPNLLPAFTIPPKLWANIGAICATIAAMTWNFLGYKFIVFKRNAESGSIS